MTNPRKSMVVWGLCVLCFIVLGGCPSSQPSKFYLLTPIALPDESRDLSSGSDLLTLGIGPIEIPDYLDRPQIVKRRSPHELELAEFHKWGEPLIANISSVLAENLSRLLLTDHIYLFPWKASVDFSYQVLVRITRFDTSPEGNAVLAARWEIRSTHEREVLAVRRSHFLTPDSGQGYEATVAAMNQNLEDLSRAIAATIQSLNK